jgi:hypothetical protein
VIARRNKLAQICSAFHDPSNPSSSSNKGLGQQHTENLINVLSDDREVILSVGWVPSHDPNGQWQGYVMENNGMCDVQNPIKDYATRSTAEMERWVREMFERFI